MLLRNRLKKNITMVIYSPRSKTPNCLVTTADVDRLSEKQDKMPLRTFGVRLINCNTVWPPHALARRCEARSSGFHPQSPHPHPLRWSRDDSVQSSGLTRSGTGRRAHLLWLITCFASRIHFIIGFKWAKTTRLWGERAVTRGKMKGGRNESHLSGVCKKKK